ncbi:MAG: hypothetical protein IH965_09805 [Gemmatimonadetes bacterium]|nr:hypothetical protein [Gemmatimonadota bacterium]
MHLIDLKDVLRRTVSGVYGDLVTRRTGQAVRGGIEKMLEEFDGEVAVIDFSTVRCLDISCADEIVGKLLLQHGHARYFLLVGLDEGHRDAIQPVLERHQLAVVAEDRSGTPWPLGTLTEPARQAFGVVANAGKAAPREVAECLAVPYDTACRALEELCERRLVLEGDGGYEPIRCA